MLLVSTEPQSHDGGTGCNPDESDGTWRRATRGGRGQGVGEVVGGGVCHMMDIICVM